MIAGGSGSFVPVAAGAKLYDALVLSDFVDLNHPGEYTIRLKREDPYTKLPVESNRVVLTVTKAE